MLNEMFRRNASKFAIFLEYKNPDSFFRFSFCATLFYFLLIREKNKAVRNEKQKKTMRVFVFQKYGKF